MHFSTLRTSAGCNRYRFDLREVFHGIHGFYNQNQSVTSLQDLVLSLLTNTLYTQTQSVGVAREVKLDLTRDKQFKCI